MRNSEPSTVIFPGNPLAYKFHASAYDWDDSIALLVEEFHLRGEFSPVIWINAGDWVTRLAINVSDDGSTIDWKFLD